MKKILSNYVFAPDSGILYFTGSSGLALENFLLATNVTQNKIIYNFADPAAGASLGSINGGFNNGLVLEYATSGVMNSGDKIQVFYDVSNERIDLASGRATGFYSGAGFTGTLYAPVLPLDIQSVGGRAVDLNGSGFYPGYQPNDASILNFEREGGGVLSYQADLDKDIDSVSNFPAGYSSVSNYVTGLITTVNATGTAPIAVSGNSNRISLFVQNMGDTILYGKYGAGASENSFSFTLSPATGWKQHNGEKWIDSLYKGDVSLNVASGFSGLYMAWEGV
jgi:hypothetical protein